MRAPSPVDEPIPYLIGSSERMVRLRAIIARFAPSGIPVLIHGPTGSGKELVARALHQLSARNGALVAVNSCAIADAMFEDALFGHVRGAFTGATGDVPGFLAEANGGTLFLDEVSGLAVASQAKLLRAIESGNFRPVGASRDRVSSFRVVAATNESLARLVELGRFRSDLRHRLSGVILDVPPLRERADDIPELVEHFLDHLGQGREYRMTWEALRQLKEHPWPGNVRELRHTIERVHLLAQGARISRDIVNEAFATKEADVEVPGPMLAQAARQFLSVLDDCGWDTARAAERLGVHRATVYRRMQRLGIPLAERPLTL